MTASVTVLLSVYRGGRFLTEQLDSLRAQTDVKIDLCFHMDEENCTEEQEITEAFPQARKLTAERPLGLPSSYLSLMRMEAQYGNFRAFSDQDDIWLPEKLIRATSALAKETRPSLWIGRAKPWTLGETLAIKQAIPQFSTRPSFANALVENVAPGFCLVWNQPLHDILTRNYSESGIVMHDAWVYAVAAAFGQILLDEEITSLYRLHDSNTIGLGRSLRRRLGRATRLRSTTGTARSQARALLDAFSQELTPAQAQAAEVVAGGSFILLLIHTVRGNIKRQTLRDTILLPLWLFFQPRC